MTIAIVTVRAALIAGIVVLAACRVFVWGHDAISADGGCATLR
tara:strand:- start:114 stop:242 length:129 start_codon:yes stop_codon:yes gene_type:complete